VPFQPLRKGEKLLKKLVHLVCIIRYLHLLLTNLLNSFKTCVYLSLFKQTRVQFRYYVLGELLVRIKIGRIRPPYKQIMWEWLLRNFFTKFLEQLFILQAHDETSVKTKVHDSRDIVNGGLQANVKETIKQRLDKFGIRSPFVKIVDCNLWGQLLWHYHSNVGVECAFLLGRWAKVSACLGTCLLGILEHWTFSTP